MTDLSVTQYNPYNMYQNLGYNYPAFRGATIPQNNYNSVPQMTQQPDTVSFSANKQIQNETNKYGLSNCAIWGIGTVAVLGLGALAYVLTKGKVGSSTVKSLAEHIDFKQATSYEEAIQFGKTHLGIKEYKGFDEKDLDVINWLNEGFVNVSNKVKGKARMPKVVKYAEQTDDTLQGVDRFKNIMLIDKRTYGDIDKSIEQKISELITKNADGTVSLPQANCTTEDFKYFTGIIKNFNVSKSRGIAMPFKDKVRLYQNLDEYVDSLAHYTYRPVSEFGTIYHECWHLLDPKLLTRSRSSSSIDQTIARTISDYATTSEAEYIGELGRKYMDSIPLSKEQIDLYNSLGGFKLPT